MAELRVPSTISSSSNTFTPSSSSSAICPLSSDVSAQAAALQSRNTKNVYAAVASIGIPFIVALTVTLAILTREKRKNRKLELKNEQALASYISERSRWKELQPAEIREVAENSACHELMSQGLVHELNGGYR